MARKFLLGDLVTLKDGSLLMTVQYYLSNEEMIIQSNQLAEEIVVCRWQGANEKEVLSIAEKELTLVYRNTNTSN